MGSAHAWPRRTAGRSWRDAGRRAARSSFPDDRTASAAEAPASTAHPPQVRVRRRLCARTASGQWILRCDCVQSQAGWLGSSGAAPFGAGAFGARPSRSGPFGPGPFGYGPVGLGRSRGSAASGRSSPAPFGPGRQWAAYRPGGRGAHCGRLGRTESNSQGHPGVIPIAPARASRSGSRRERPSAGAGRVGS